MAFTELWLVTGNQPGPWRIPYFVKWTGVTGTEGEMWPAIPLLKRHERIVAETISVNARALNGAWAITLDALNHIAVQYEFTGDLSEDKIESLFYWGRERDDKEAKRTTLPDNEDFNDMVDYAMSIGIGEVREQVLYWFSQLIRVMQERLVNQERPVDLGFIKLHNCPYRVNWKSILMSRYPTLGRALTAAGDIKKAWPIAHRALFIDEMMSLDLLSTSRHGGHCLRTIEIEYKPKWWKVIGRAERDRKTQLGEYAYAQYVIHSMRGHLRKNLALYISYCAQVALNSAAHVEGEWVGTFKLIPHSPNWKLVAKEHGHWPLPSVVDNKPGNFKPASDTEYLRLAYEVMPPLSALQSCSQNVRDVESDLAKKIYQRKK